MGNDLTMRMHSTLAVARAFLVAAATQEVKVDGTERALKTGNRIAPEFARAVCGLDHATRQQLVSVLSKAQTKRCIATSATAAFDKCTEVSARPLGEEGMLPKKRPKKMRPKKTPK